MRPLLPFLLMTLASAQSSEFVLPGYSLDVPLHVACLSPQRGNIAIEVLDASGTILSRFERGLNGQSWQNWQIYPGTGSGQGSLRLRLRPEAVQSLNGFLFIGRDRPFAPGELPAPPLCQDSCFLLLPSAAPKLGRFGFTLSAEAAVSVRIVASSNPPRVIFEENLGRRPAGPNAYDWDLVLHPAQGVDHVGLFTLTGKKEFVLVFARVTK